MKRPAIVSTISGLKEDFEKTFRKGKPRANAAWESLVAKRTSLEQDTTYGDPIQRRLWPKRFAELTNLYRLELANDFRALYTVYFDHDVECHVVNVEWIGDHKAYDVLFGYSTS